ncbi:MAG: SDR family oxidoreductase [Bacteroidales bacterium]|nr:SDR family oxidoreductase [Bacteroidales bacterium]
MNNKILIIGATGTIGSSLVRYLHERKADFTAMVRSVEQAKALNKRGMKTVLGDLEDIQSLQKALEGMDKVFLLSKTSPDSPRLQSNMVKAASDTDIKHIVKIAARGSAIDADFNIGRWHGITEEEIRNTGMDYTFLHAHTFLQNLFFDAQTIQEENAIYSSQGEGKIPMVDTRDIAAVAAKVLTESGHSGKTYLLTGPEAVSYHDIASALTELLGRKIEYVSQTSEEGEKAMVKTGMPPWMVEDMVLLNKRYARNEAIEVSRDIERIIGRKAKTLSEFLNDYKFKFIS